MLTWWSKKRIWLALLSFRNISSVFPVWKKNNKNALAKAYVAKADCDSVSVSKTPGDKQKVQVPPQRHFMSWQMAELSFCVKAENATQATLVTCLRRTSKHKFELGTWFTFVEGKGAVIESLTDWEVNGRKSHSRQRLRDSSGLMSLVWLFLLLRLFLRFGKGNRSIQALHEQKTLDQIELRWVHPMPRWITSVCTASTDSWLLLCCTFHSECPDLSL